MSIDHDSATLAPLLPFDEFRRSSLREHLLDRLVDFMLDADDVLEMLRKHPGREFDWMDQPLRRTVDDVDGLLRRLTE